MVRPCPRPPRAFGYDTSHTPPGPIDPNTLWAPFFAPDEPDVSGYGNRYLDDNVPEDKSPEDRREASRSIQAGSPRLEDGEFVRREQCGF
jgi:hypothetical protein